MRQQVEQPRPPTLRTRFLAGLVSGIARALFATLHLRVEREDDVEAVLREHGGIILVTWHGRTLMPIVHFRGRGYLSIVSLSKDGNLQAEVLRQLGWRAVRGSTGRRGVQAAREVLTAFETPGTVLAFTPDGPRGPLHTCHPGVVYFAQRTGKPIVPAGIAAHPAWHMGSWDRFLVPKPFARAHWVYGDPIFVGDGDDTEAVCRRVEGAIAALERRAEASVGAPLTSDAPAAAAASQPDPGQDVR